MLFNTLVSFIATITLAGSVTAAATPRWGSPPLSGQSCSTGSLTCCQSASSFADLPTILQEGLVSALDPNVLANVPIGLNCDATGLLGWYCISRLVY